METCVINVAAFCDGKMRDDLLRLTEIRNKVLDECYSIKGYAEMSCEEKARIYDSIHEMYMKEAEI